MTREEQDKLWAELSEESKKRIRKEYNNSIQSLPIEESKRGVIYSYECLFGEHNLKPTLTYKNVAKELFKEGAYSPTKNTALFEFRTHCTEEFVFNCTSIEQSKKLKAINKLLNVAKFLNKNEDGTDWVPDWENKNEFDNRKWFIYLDNDGNIDYCWDVDCLSRFVYFRTEELAKQAVQILGEDVVRTALTTDY